MSTDPHKEVRSAARQRFISAVGWADAVVEPQSGDASFRRYFRLRRPDGSRAMLMDAPPARERLPEFLLIDRHLASLGLLVPTVYDSDLEQGFALLEDLGDDTFTRLLARHPQREEALYDTALDVLLQLNRNASAAAIALPPYDLDALLDEAALLYDWFLPVYGDGDPAAGRDGYLAAWSTVLQRIPAQPITLVLRDFHVDNLMLVTDGQGRQSCALLDFQDALLGHPAYDLVSLLEDARRDVADGLRQQLYRRFCDALAVDESFADNYAILAAQRHAKVLGIFVRLFRRDGKDSYLQHLPRVAALLRRHLDRPVLREVSAWTQCHLPQLLDASYTPDAQRCRDYARREAY